MGITVDLVVFYVSTLMFLAIILLALPVYLSYRQTRMTLMLVRLHVQTLLGAAEFSSKVDSKFESSNKPTAGDIQRLYTSVVELAKMDMTPLARTTIAVFALTILAISIFQLIIANPTIDVGPIVNNLLSVLAGLLSAVVGFYFGSKAAGEGGNGKPPVAQSTH